MESAEAEQFRNALGGLLAGDTFLRSPALGRLLTYLVERVLAGEAATLKESVIGHELYGRPASYDPKLDSQVRVSANRLRTRLEEHYRVNPSERVRIVLPKGSYIPQLEVLPEPTEPSASTSNADLQAAMPVSAMPGPGPGAGQAELVSRDRHVAASRVSPFALLALSFAIVVLAAFFWRHTRYPAEAPVDKDWSVQPFARLGGSQQFGAFSPDGTRIAFTSTATNDTAKAIYIQAIGSEEARRIAAGVRPSWSPDGKRLAFLRPEDNGRRGVILYDLATGTETKLTELVGVGPWLCQVPRLSWSRDGSVLYSTASTGSNPICGIVTIDVKSGQVRSLMPPSSRVGDLDPTVSPDGSTLAFMREVALGACDLFLVSTHGGEARRITHDGANIVGFDWTPDGKALIVASEREGGARKLWRTPVDGGPLQALTDGSSMPTFPSVNVHGKLINFTQFHVTAPIWKAAAGKTVEVLDNQSKNATPAVSPDGKKMLYGSDRAGKWAVWLSNADGSESRPLLRGSPYAAGSGRWSPDGSLILSDCQHGKHTHVCLSNAEGENVRQLTDENTSQVNPSWSRDGRSIYFAADSSGRWQIYRMRVTGGAAELVTTEGGIGAVESWDGKWLYVARGERSNHIVALPIKEAGREGQGLESIHLLEMHADLGYGWDACKEGIVYADSDESSLWLNVFDMKTRTSRLLVTLGKQEAGTEVSISVLPDGVGVAYTASRTHSELSMMSVRR